MTGYCQDCQKTVEMEEVQTIQLPNLDFVHQGICTTEDCGAKIYRFLRDSEILVSEGGKKYPRFIFALGRKEFKKRSWIGLDGQTVVLKDSIVRKSAGGVIRTLKSIRKEVQEKGKKHV